MHAIPSGSAEPPAIISTHFADVRQVLSEVEPDAVQRVVDIFRAARDRGSFIYIAGNGGSSATASHWTNDLGKATNRNFSTSRCVHADNPRA